jgi:hypothetical protein
MDAVTLDPKQGHEGSYYVRMSWGDEVQLPAETDGGAVERGEVAVTFLSRLVEDHDNPNHDHPTKAELALDSLLLT